MNAPEKPKSKVEVTQIGNALGVVLPEDVLAALKVAEGDQLSIVETPDGIELRPYDATFEEQMAIARAVMRRYYNTLKKLAE